MGKLTFNSRECPECSSINTRWRSGVHFEYERICVCGNTYDPSEEYEKYLAAERERLEYNTSKE